MPTVVVNAYLEALCGLGSEGEKAFLGQDSQKGLKMKMGLYRKKITFFFFFFGFNVWKQDR